MFRSTRATDLGNGYTVLGSKLSSDDFKNEKSLWGESQVHLPLMSSHVVHWGCPKRSTHESDIMALVPGWIERSS